MCGCGCVDVPGTLLYSTFNEYQLASLTSTYVQRPTHNLALHLVLTYVRT